MIINSVERIDKLIEKLTSFLLVIAIFSMLFFSFLNIVLRLFQTSLIWIEPFVRHLVFLSAFLGGIMATGKKGHISIDLLGKALEAKKMFKSQKLIERLIYIVSIFTLVWISYSSIDFIQSEMEYGKEVFLGIKSFYLTLIIPIGMSLIAFRFFNLLTLTFRK